MKTLQQAYDLSSASRGLSTADFLGALLIALIMIIIYSAIIWFLWNTVLTRVFAGVRPISILQALGVKILIDLLF